MVPVLRSDARAAGQLGMCALVGFLAAGCLGDPFPAPGSTASSSTTTTTVAAPPLRTTADTPQPPPSEDPLTLSLSSPLTATAKPTPPPLVPLSGAVPCGAKSDPPWPITNPDIGQWGEDLHTAPDFGYVQERRAPKMPDGGVYLARIPTRTVQQLDNALLICHVETYTRNGGKPLFYRYKLGKPNAGRPDCVGDWDFFAGPDLLIKFRLRGEDPISLYGPEDHFGFFISVPRVRLARGDFLEVKLWDRDSTGDSVGAAEEDVEYMGYASTTLTGSWPIRLSGPYFTMKCNAMSGVEAERSAASWLAALDDTIHTLETRKPDPKQWDFGERTMSFDKGEFSFGKGNFRYVAGFLGWDHPTILDRRAKVRRIVDVEWPRKRSEAARLLVKQSPAPGKPMALGGRRGTLRANGVVCQGSSCVVTLDLTGGSVAPGSPDWKVEMASINAEGIFHAATLDPSGDQTATPGKVASYQTDLGSSALVLWIKAPGGVYTVKVRDPS